MILKKIKVLKKKIDIDESRKTNQLHFVGYKFVVSATSSSTKVRMTMDSSMHTETGLSLNDVTHPAPGDVPMQPPRYFNAL